MSARAKRRQWEVRRTAPPRASFEELEVHTTDGVALRGTVDDPPEGVALRGTCVLSHAMFARKSSFGKRDRPGLAAVLTKRGFRTIAFDFRGHGDSALPAGRDWGYDDLVRLDLPTVVDCAKTRGEGHPVVVIGHSLGGHVAIASQGTGRLGADGIVGIAMNVWLESLEPSALRWALKFAVARLSLAAVRRIGSVPARRLRIGSDDASARYLDDLFRAATRGVWTSADGADDYFAAMKDVTIPVANVLGERDRLMCHPASGEAFTKRCGGPVALFRASGAHMDLVTGGRGTSAILEALEWVIERPRLH